MNQKYDQYMQFENLPKLLKRFSFSEKMRIACEHSRQILSIEGTHDISKLEGQPLPWELETFTMLSMEAYEYSNDDFVGANELKFRKMIAAIRNCVPRTLRNNARNGMRIEHLLPSTALVQFPLQESYWIKYYRYWCIFSSRTADADMAAILVCPRLLCQNES